MNNDADWVQDVKRWYHSSSRAGFVANNDAGTATDYSSDIGYEAAQPSLQALDWPDRAPLTTDR